MPVVALTCAWCFEFRQSEPLLPSLPTITDKGRPFPAAPKILYRSISNAKKQLCKGQTVPNLRLYTSRPLQYFLKAVIKKGPHEQPQSWRCEHNLRTPTSKHLPRGPAILLSQGARADLGTTQIAESGSSLPSQTPMRLRPLAQARTSTVSSRPSCKMSSPSSEPPSPAPASSAG